MLKQRIERVQATHIAQADQTRAVAAQKRRQEEVQRLRASVLELRVAVRDAVARGDVVLNPHAGEARDVAKCDGGGGCEPEAEPVDSFCQPTKAEDREPENQAKTSATDDAIKAASSALTGTHPGEQDDVADGDDQGETKRETLANCMEIACDQELALACAYYYMHHAVETS